ncbi:MAG: cupin domain-containing protein, partial [Giesbergeria sp.]
MEDVSAFSDELAKGQKICFEDFVKDNYLDAIIEKPWGHEYRIYADMLIDVWKLMLASGQSTSMHCHHRKETVLMCLAGSLQINFLSRSILVEAGQFAHIPKGVFHSTDNVGDTDAHLIEVETPRNKFDLVRMKDRYGRQSQPYETGKSPVEIPELRGDPGNPYVKIRHKDLQGLFAFDVLTGAQIKNRKQLPDFSVSISIEAAINQRIEIFDKNMGSFQKIKSDVRYLI